MWDVKAKQLKSWVDRGLLNVKLLDRTLAYFQNQTSYLQYIKTLKRPVPKIESPGFPGEGGIVLLLFADSLCNSDDCRHSVERILLERSDCNVVDARARLPGREKSRFLRKIISRGAGRLETEDGTV